LVTERQLRRRIEGWQKALWPLGLGHWQLDSLKIVEQADPGKSEREAAASVGRAWHYDTFDLEFTRSALEEATPEDLDQTIIHELLHLVFRDHDRVFEQAESWVPPAGWESLTEMMEHEVEGIIDRMARTIYHVYSQKVVQ
jgi:hypothetical protein